MSHLLHVNCVGQVPEKCRVIGDIAIAYGTFDGHMNIQLTQKSLAYVQVAWWHVK